MAKRKKKVIPKGAVIVDLFVEAKKKQKEEGKTLGGKPTLSQKSAKGSIDTREEVAKLKNIKVSKFKLIDTITGERLA